MIVKVKKKLANGSIKIYHYEKYKPTKIPRDEKLLADLIIDMIMNGKPIKKYIIGLKEEHIFDEGDYFYIQNMAL